MANNSKPDKRKELAGTLVNHRKSTAKLPAAVEKVRSRNPNIPPEWLDDTGKDVYCTLINHLQSVDALWTIDVFIIEQAAYWKSLHVKAIQDLGGAEMIQTFETGARQISPEFQVLEKAETHVRKYFELLGIGPKSREGIGVFNTTGGSESEDPFTRLTKKFEADQAEIV